MTKATHKTKHLIGGLLSVSDGQSITILPVRKHGAEAEAEDFTSGTTESKQRTIDMGLAWGFEAIKPTSND